MIFCGTLDDCDDRNDVDDDGCSACAWSTLVYDIQFGDLFGLPTDCSDGTNPYTGCSPGVQWGFTWDDQTPYVPQAVAVELNHGIQCASGVGKMPTLNGIVAGTFDLVGGDCFCFPAENEFHWDLNDSAIAGYQQGQQNTFSVTASTSCEGLSANDNWGNGIYARVLVDP